MEMSHNLKELLENIIVTDAMTAGTVLDVYIELIQDDGGSYSACINALTLALADARIPIRDYVVSCTATITHSVPMIDINAQERGTSPELTIAITAKNNEIIVLEQTHLMPSMYLKDVIEEGIKGCQKVYKFIEEAVKHQSSVIDQALKSI
jgi:exosome complex component RRP41